MTVTGERYRAFVRIFTNDLRTVLSARQFREAWFMQDEAPVHTAHDTIVLLKTIFGNRMIALTQNGLLTVQISLHWTSGFGVQPRIQ